MSQDSQLVTLLNRVELARETNPRDPGPRLGPRKGHIH